MGSDWNLVTDQTEKRPWRDPGSFFMPGRLRQAAELLRARGSSHGLECARALAHLHGDWRACARALAPASASAPTRASSCGDLGNKTVATNLRQSGQFWQIMRYN